MTTKIDLNDFAEAARLADGTYDGHYHGRAFFKGYAAYFPDVGALLQFGANLSESSELKHLLDHEPHVDNMAGNVLIAYREDLFDETTDPGSENDEDEDNPRQDIIG